MKNLVLGAGAVILASSLTACGSGAGADACETYKDAVAEDPAAVADLVALADIKDMLSDLDKPTRRAFASLITAADANPFSAGGSAGAVQEAAAEVRSVCLAEHDVEIPN
ncbi:hypothetical protein ACFFOS_27925 [Nocardioides kongjuensis]|uniref:Putative alpha-E superfamily protein n=1 Tax=Nocardioides kongjuensis TaxID=349522 RepID=A0A852RSH4_9ACTN|nr:hypothetical protein [Nocardioides kongjuensis]NYD33835.1 putative alpha-E superfamily protein [Nocardioides kongjuensis]